MAAPNLISFQEYLDYTAQSEADLGAPETARIENTITAASEVIRGFTDRNLELATDETQGVRQFRYLGTGTLEIDDAESINAVSTVATTFAASRTLDPTEWFAMDEGRPPVITYIEFYTRFISSGLSPEMGFKRNLDTYPYVPYPTVVSVDANWGWPEIPEKVKQAAVWTVESFINFKGQSPLNSESIASFSRTFNQFQPRSRTLLVQQALPELAIAALEPYMRISV